MNPDTEYTVSIRITFPEAVTAALKQEKDRFVASYGSSYKSDPHVTVYLDRYTPEGFAPLLSALRTLLFAPFEVSLLEPRVTRDETRGHMFYIVDVTPKGVLEKLHAAVLALATPHRSPLLREKEQKRFDEGKLSKEAYAERMQHREAGTPYQYDPHITLGDVAFDAPQPDMAEVARNVQDVIGTKIEVKGLDVFFHSKAPGAERAEQIERVFVPFVAEPATSATHSKNPYDEKLTAQYSLKYQADYPHQYMSYATWLEEMGDISGKRVLDLACGSGVSTRMLAAKGAHVVGVDISEPMLTLAKKEELKQPMSIEYVLADASVPKAYAEKPFDLVAAAFLLHYAYSREMLDGFTKNAAANLTSGGKFITINLNPAHPIVLPEAHVNHSSVWLDEPFKDGSRLEVKLWTKDSEEICTLIDYHWSREVYEKSLTDAGFTDMRWVDVRMHEEGKKIAGWEELEKKNMLVVIEATKL